MELSTPTGTSLRSGTNEMTSFDDAYKEWRQAPFPKGSSDDAVDELHAELAQWDAFVADEVIAIADGRTPQPGVVDIRAELDSFQMKIAGVEANSHGAAREQLAAYRHYCALLINVYREAQRHRGNPG